MRTMTLEAVQGNVVSMDPFDEMSSEQSRQDQRGTS